MMSAVFLLVILSLLSLGFASPSLQHVSSDLDLHSESALNLTAGTDFKEHNRRVLAAVEARRKLLVSSCATCPASGSGLSRCFLCQAFRQTSGTYYKTKKCKSAYCSYKGGVRNQYAIGEEGHGGIGGQIAYEEKESTYRVRKAEALEGSRN